MRTRAEGLAFHGGLSELQLLHILSDAPQTSRVHIHTMKPSYFMTLSLRLLPRLTTPLGEVRPGSTRLVDFGVACGGRAP